MNALEMAMAVWLLSFAFIAQSVTFVMAGNQPVPCHWCGASNPPGSVSCSQCGQFLG